MPLSGGRRQGQLPCANRLGYRCTLAPPPHQGNLLDLVNTTFGQGISQVTKQVKTLLASECGWFKGRLGAGGGAGVGESPALRSPTLDTALTPSAPQHPPAG